VDNRPDSRLSAICHQTSVWLASCDKGSSRRKGPTLSARFAKALEGLDHRNWQLFEEIASKFLADEFPNLRSLADTSGDGGRDGVLFASSDLPSLALQYSVTEGVSAKIRATAKTLDEKHKNVTNLIFVTPRSVSTAVKDEEVAYLRKHYQLHLDIRDASWFIDREDRSPSTRKAADLAARRIVDPLLQSASLLENATPTLSSEDTRSALFFLSMQREDDDRDRGLTKLCFDALVRAVLRGTDSDHLMTRTEVHEAVERLVPSQSAGDVAMYADRALSRLERKAIRHHEAVDSFCLSYEERTRLVESMLELQKLEASFDEEILRALRFVVESMDGSPSDVTDEHLARVRRILEAFLFGQGESLVASLSAGQPPLFLDGDLSSAIQSDIAASPDVSSLRHTIVPVIEEAVRRVIFDPTESTMEFLHAAKEAYTLYAFLRESPNVQAAVTKIFAGGELWLDTTVILPLLAEHLLEPMQRNYSRLFEAAREADVRLLTTPGVLEEINSHLNRCRAAIRYGVNFRGRSPFILNAFVWSGRPLDRFGDFESELRGERHPEEDIAEFLKDEFDIDVRPLSAEVASADDELRWAVEEYWRQAHSGRRVGSDAIDPELVERLAAHDTESFLGVVQRRGGELIGNPLGYRTWWLTVDTKAIVAAERVAKEVGMSGLDTPVIGLDFLSYYLLVGDARRQLSKETARSLPAFFDTSLMEVLPKDLVAAAEQVRASLDGSNARVMRRQIRDMLESERIRSGKTGRIGIEAIQYDIEMSLKG